MTARVSLVAALLGAGAAVSLAADATLEDLRAQIQALQTKVADLEARSVTTADVDATVRKVLADADARSRAIPAGMTAGYTSRGFVIQDAKGDFLLHPYLQFQIRNASNWRSDASGGNDDFENGFEVRRMKYGFEGNAYTPALTYQFQWATNRGTSNPELEDAWVKYQINPDWGILAGQFKDPVFREGLVSSMKQLAAERSLLNGILEGGDNYIQGVGATYGSADRFHAQAAFTDGFAGANANFQDPQGDPSDGDFVPNGNKKYDFGVAARAEYMVLGDPKTTWKQYSQFTALGAKEDMLILGTAADWSQGGDAHTVWYTFDAQWEPVAIRGLSLYGAVVGRSSSIGNPEADGARDSFNDWGFLVQAGYLVNNHWEPFVRYDFTRANNALLSSDAADAYGTRNLHEITAGVNYYFYGQNAKLTLDLTYLPNGTPISSSGADLLSQPSDNEQWLTRLQFQLIL